MPLRLSAFRYLHLQVNAQGESFGPVTTEKFNEPMKSTSPLDMCNEKQLTVAEMQPAERSMYMWRKVGLGHSLGCLLLQRWGAYLCWGCCTGGRASAGGCLLAGYCT